MEPESGRTPSKGHSAREGNLNKTSLMLLLVGLLLAGCTGQDPAPDRALPDAGGPASVEGRTSLGSCVEQYSPQALGNRRYAFDGEVQRVEAPTGEADAEAPGETLVTFRVNRWFKGGTASTVTLRSAIPVGTAVTSADQSGLSLTEGGRYLVSGDEDFIWSCGFTAAFSDSLAAEWELAAN